MRPETRAVLLDGLRGAADYGTASAFKSAGISALAKTGTILMPSGAALGLVVALTPADKPTRAIVVAAPGGAGLDAAAIAAEIEGERGRGSFSPSDPNPRRSTGPLTATNSGQEAKKIPGPVSLRLGRTLANGSTRVESLAIDDYIGQVLAGEGQPRAGDAAQQALAITARTFALANRNRHRARRIRSLRHHALPGGETRDGRYPPRRPGDQRPRAAASGAAGVRVLFRVVRRPVRAGVAGLARRDRLCRCTAAA